MSEFADQFEQEAGFSVYRPKGAVSVNEGIDLLIGAVRYAREQGIEKLLIDVTQLTGVNPPDFWQRTRMAVRSAEEGRSSVIVAVVAPEELIDRQKIGVHMARNRGLLMDVFTNEQDAREWLSNPS